MLIIRRGAAGLSYAVLTVDFPPMTISQHEYQQSVIFNSADDPVIANSILPELAQPGAMKCRPNASGVFELGDPVPQKLQNSSGNLSIQFV